MIMQDTYLQDVLVSCNMSNCTLVLAPLHANTKLSKDDAPQNLEDKQQMTSIPYAQGVGNLMRNNVNT
jgi:hypothetical protein